MPLTEEQTAKIRDLSDQICEHHVQCVWCKELRAQIAAIQAEGADGAGMESDEMMPTEAK